MVNNFNTWGFNRFWPEPAGKHPATNRKTKFQTYKIGLKTWLLDHQRHINSTRGRRGARLTKLSPETPPKSSVFRRHSSSSAAPWRLPGGATASKAAPAVERRPVPTQRNWRRPIWWPDEREISWRRESAGELGRGRRNLIFGFPNNSPTNFLFINFLYPEPNFLWP